ncbi:thioredoxin family protein [Alkalibacterium sp.]|nr:MAG: thioredoxin [Alkalibacterium sp.]
MKVELTEENFNETLNAAPLVLVHFTSDFCGPCKIMKRALNALEEKYTSRLALAEVKAMDHPDWATAFAIQSTPTVLLFHKGKYQSRLTGAHTNQIIEEWIKEATA